MSEKKTNIVFIVLDDMGFSDIGCFGSEIRTPNLDQLAAEGLRYNNFNVCPACSPTRASLLTGRNHNSVGMGNIANCVLDDIQPDMQGRIYHNAGTIAETLKMNGYSTYAVGKWHVAPIEHETPAGPFDYWPLNKGFERYYGYLDGESDQYSPQLVSDNHEIDPPRRTGYHLTEDIIDQSIKMVSSSKSIYPEKPVFMYICFGVAHSPHQVPRSYIDSYKGVYNKGWDVIREERFARQIEMGIVPEGSVMTARDPFVQEWDKLDEERKTLYARFQEAYAGYVTHCDENVGRFLNFMKEIDEYDNTLFVVLSDNGASRDGGTEGIDDFYRTMNGSSPVFEDLYAKIDDIGGPEMKALYPKGWAMAGNTPFKEYKGTNFGGGVRTPMFLKWSKEIKDPGNIRSQLVSVEDVYPMVMDVLGLEYPEYIKGIAQMPVQGISFRNTFEEAESESAREFRFSRWVNTFALTTPEWKAVSVHAPGREFADDEWQLFHLTEDFAEANNVAAKYPDVLQKMKDRWTQLAPQYVTLPLKPMSPQAFDYIPLDSPAREKHFRFLPKMERVGSLADPFLENQNHTIEADIERASASEEGVLIASGGVSGGYTLFVMKNKLYYVNNFFFDHYTIESKDELPIGKCNVKFSFEKTAAPEGAGPREAWGIGKIYINGKEEGSKAMRIAPHGFAIEGMDIGRDGLTPVSPIYKKMGDFPFTGKLKEIRIDVE